jgi:DNA-binding transcriptional MocR family regulator
VSVRVMAAVFDHSETTGITRLVLLALSDHADHDGVAWPSVDTVARKCRVDRRTVQRAYNECEALGELAREIGGGAADNTTLYRVVLPGVGPGDNRGTRGGTVTPLGAAGLVERGGRIGRKGRHSAAQTIIEPSENRGADNDMAVVSPPDLPPPDPDVVARVAEIRARLKGGPHDAG